MTNQELFEKAVAGNWIAETFERPTVGAGIGKFYLKGTSRGYATFGDTVNDGDVVFYAAFDDDCNRESGFGVFNADDQSITPVESNATLANGKYIDGDVQPIPFPKGGTITGTFNAVAFNAIWKHVWDRNNPHEVVADQVEQDNDNDLGDNVQDALDNLSGIIAEWDAAIKATCQNYVSELPPANPDKGDMWTDVGVSGEQYVWEGDYWVSVTGGGLGIDLEDPEALPRNIVRDEVGDEIGLLDKPLNRVISSYDGAGKWVEAGGDDLWVASEPNNFGQRRAKFSDQISNPDDPHDFSIRYSTDPELGTTSNATINAYKVYAKGIEAIGQIASDSVVTQTVMTAAVEANGNITAEGVVQAADFLDADGNSIIGAGGGGGGVDFPENDNGYAWVATPSGWKEDKGNAQQNWIYRKAGTDALIWESKKDHNTMAYSKAICIGFENKAAGKEDILLGHNNYDMGEKNDGNNILIGKNNSCLMMDNVVAIGRDHSCQYTGNDPDNGCVAIGQGNTVEGSGIAIGKNCTAKDGQVVIGGKQISFASDLVDAFTTLQTAIADETTIEGIKTALTNSLGGLIEKFEGLKNA